MREGKEKEGWEREGEGEKEEEEEAHFNDGELCKQ